MYVDITCDLDDRDQGVESTKVFGLLIETTGILCHLSHVLYSLPQCFNDLNPEHMSELECLIMIVGRVGSKMRG